MNANTHPPIDFLGLPIFWQEGVLSRVHLGENVLAWLEVDLNDELRFKKTLLILTDQRVFSTDEAQKSWNSSPLSPDLTLRVLDHAGVGTLALHQGATRLAAWRFTLGLEAAVLRWKLRFESQLGQAGTSGYFMGQSLGVQGPDDADWVEPGVAQMRHVLCPLCQNVVDALDESVLSVWKKSRRRLQHGRCSSFGDLRGPTKGNFFWVLF